jgi:hypothetical protein
MFSALPASNRRWRRLRVVHHLRDTFPGPYCLDTVIQIHDVLCSFPDLVCIEDDIVMVIVKHERDIELFADREEVVDRIAHIVILKNRAVWWAVAGQHSSREGG